MEKLELPVKQRKERGKQVRYLREKSMIPAVVYGTDIENQFISLDYNTFIRLYEKSGESSIIKLKVDDKDNLDVLIQDVQYDPVSEMVIHVDFYKIKRGQKLNTDIELEFIGESKAVKDLNGTLYKGLDAVEVQVLPKDLVSEIKVDLSILNTFEDKILVKDIKVPEGIEILNDPDIVVAKVDPPRSEEELKALDEEVVEDVEAVEKVEGENEEAEGEESTEAKPEPEAEKTEEKKE